MSKGAGPRAAKPDDGQRRNGQAIRLGSSALARLEPPISAAAVRF